MKYYDERDTLFSRVILEKGSNNYNDYYKRHPKYKYKDDSIRVGPFRDQVNMSDYKKDLFLGLASQNKTIIKSLFSTAKEEQVNTRRVDIDPSFSSNIKELVKYFGALDVGIVKMTDDLYYTHSGGLATIFGIDDYGEKIKKSYHTAIVFTVDMDKELIKHAPMFEELLATENAYTKISYISSRLTLYLKGLGYKASGMNSEYYIGPLVPLAYEAGLGEIGMCNHLVTKTHGNNVRLGVVYTTLKLDYDEKKSFGLEEFCKECSLCLMNCPNNAISFKKRMVFDRPFYKFDENACFEVWTKTGTDCGICLNSCPFTHGIDQDLIAQMKGNKKLIKEIVKTHISKHGRKPKKGNCGITDV